MPATLILRDDRVKQTARHYIDIAPPDTVVKFYAPSRTGSQNALLWVLLGEVASQSSLHGVQHTKEGWKVIFMSALGHESKFVLGINHEVVPLEARTSKMSKEQMTDLIEFIFQYGAENGVTFDEPD